MYNVFSAAALSFLLSFLPKSAVVKAAGLPRAAPSDTPWDELAAKLLGGMTGSSNDGDDDNAAVLTAGGVAEWNSECVQVFRDVTAIPEVDGTFPVISNYLLMNQPSGLCLDHVSCAFEHCAWPVGNEEFPRFNTDRGSPFVLLPDTPMDFSLGDDADATKADAVASQIWLPARVLHPRSVADLVTAVQFCREHNVGVTVKVAGHSYFGASNANQTLLIKMNPSYPKYATQGSLTECATVEPPTSSTSLPTAHQMACAVAQARNKKAVLRVGGGELFDEAYRAVFNDWNQNNATTQKYHLVGGGAGTVSAAGGWLASGGLSGTTGMRMYGIGIDQVVAMEMVLPSGQHVRFAPTAWTSTTSSSADEGYPQTINVTGYCNANPTAVDESLWEWGPCDDDGNSTVNFNDLWYAVRGGGGGTYGIVTSVHYQLHDYPGLLQVVQQDPLVYPTGDGAGTVPDEAAYLYATHHVDFVLRFLYLPALPNVTEQDSRGCNSAMTASLSPFVEGNFFCYGTSGTVMVQAWVAYITSATVVQGLQAAGAPDDFMASLPNLYKIAAVLDSYADAVASDGTNPSIPVGRLADNPPGSIVPVLSSFPYLSDSMGTHFPLDVIQADPTGMARLIAADVLQFGSTTLYALGGFVPAADDGLNALSPTRRQAAFLKGVVNEDMRNQYYAIFYERFDPTKDDFPGSSCHNHALIFEMGPLRDDWTKTCPIDWPQAEREAKCISQNEASWGTAHLARLEAIKAALDPNHLFVCAAGIGYANPDNGGSAPPTTAPSAPTNSTQPDQPAPLPTSTPPSSGNRNTNGGYAAIMVSVVVAMATVVWMTSLW